MDDTTDIAKAAAQLTLDIMKITEGYPDESLTRAFQAVLMLRGLPSSPMNADRPSQVTNVQVGEFADTKIGPKALKWIQKNEITRAQLEELFHLTGDTVEVTASEIPGASKRDMTINCYLLMGVRGLLQFDEPKLDESETLDLCKRLTAYDKNNHTTFRKNVGNRMTGAKPDFVLTGPGERAGAELVKLMTGG